MNGNVFPCGRIRGVSDIDEMAEFMEERVNEDESAAEALDVAARLPGKVPDFFGAGGPAAEAFWERFGPLRVLAGVEAKRLVLSEWAALSGLLEGQAMRGEPVDKVMAFQVRVLEGTMRKLCTEWKAHPGYKGSWKP